MNRRQIIKELQDKKNAKQILPLALHQVAEDDMRYALLSFTMNYYNYYEITTQESCEEADLLFKRLSKEVFRIFVEENHDYEENSLISDIKNIREQLMQLTESMTAYADLFSLYEYLLNRIEKRFTGHSKVEEDEIYTEQIFGEIFSNQNQMEINRKIRLMMSQLPIRMTRQKFYDYLKDSFSIYKNSDLESMERYMYLLRTAAGLGDVKLSFESQTQDKLEQIRHQMDAMDIAKMSEESFSQYQSLFHEAAQLITQLTERLYSLASVVNSFYTILLLQPYLDVQSIPHVTTINKIIEDIATRVKLSSVESVPEETVELFSLLEGTLEQAVDDMNTDAAIFDLCKSLHEKEIEAMPEYELYNRIEKASKLCSDSLFIELEAQDKSHKVTSNDLDALYQSIVTELEHMFKSKEKIYQRAVMAAMLGEMPVVFNNAQEVKEYIQGALRGCQDTFEKSTSVELFLTNVN